MHQPGCLLKTVLGTPKLYSPSSLVLEIGRNFSGLDLDHVQSPKATLTVATDLKVNEGSMMASNEPSNGIQDNVKPSEVKAVLEDSTDNLLPEDEAVAAVAKTVDCKDSIEVSLIRRTVT